MEKRHLHESDVYEFEAFMRRDEKSGATVEKYLRDVWKFWRFAAGRPVTKELVMAYKEDLIRQAYAVRSVNSMLASLNCFLRFLGWEELTVKSLKQQTMIFSPEEKELTKAEYMRLLEAARPQRQLSLILQTICATGIRVSELKYFTVESVRRGAVRVYCKNKNRTILIPGRLKALLLRFAREEQIKAGSIFVTRGGKPLDRSNIWARMKRLCKAAGVRESKVFPHNLRKLFARTFYKIEKDIAKLADILGHSSINTTRIYIMSTGAEHRRKIERLGLLL